MHRVPGRWAALGCPLICASFTASGCAVLPAQPISCQAPMLMIPSDPATNYHPVIYHPMPDQLSVAVQACLHPEPHKRLTCQQLLGLPYFREAIHTFPMEVLKAQVRCAAWLTPHHGLCLLGSAAAQALSPLRRLANGVECPSGCTRVSHWLVNCCSSIVRAAAAGGDLLPGWPVMTAVACTGGCASTFSAAAAEPCLPDCHNQPEIRTWQCRHCQRCSCCS